MLTEVDFTKLSMLVVDDSRFMRRLTVDILESFGVGTILQAESPEDAFAKLANNSPDLIISDWQMHPTDGLSFLRQLRSHADRAVASTPFLMVTGHASDEYVLAAKVERANSFIVKPYSISTLMTHILRILEDVAEAQVGEVWHIA